MKNSILFLGIILNIFISCAKEDKQDIVKPITHKIVIKFSNEFKNKLASNVFLNLINKETSQKYTAKTNEKGVAEINIMPGTYSIEANVSFYSNEMKEKLGVDEGDATFSDSVYEVSITNKNNTPTFMTLIRGKSGNIIIKQIYYTGSHRKEGSSFRDQFFEIHNNSNETVYLDELCFAQICGVTKIPSKLETYHLPSGQYDYSKSFGNIDLGNKANENFVYGDQIISFPGNGKEHPLKSGKSVIVASTAINHKQPLTVINRGKSRVYKALNPSLTLDLSNASFEVYEGKPFAPFSVDTPAKNMKINYNINPFDFFLNTYGVDAYVIFYAKASEISKWRRVPLPNAHKDRIDKAKKYIQIPKNIIVDGVELQHYDDQKQKPKRLHKSIDIGHIKGIKGGYSSESAIRKIKKIEGDKIFYQDTNNSSEDFKIIDFPDTNSLKL